MDSLIAAVLDSIRRGQSPPSEALARLGEPDPAAAADALLEASRRPELAATRSSWVPALLLAGEPGRGARALYDLADACAGAGTPLDLSRMPALPLVLGASDRLSRVLLERPEWTLDLAADPPPAPSEKPPAADWDAIRDWKGRGLLRAAARELLGCPLQESFRELSWIADAALLASLRLAAREVARPAPAMLALGSLGGGEFGVGSEVELLFLGDGSELDDPVLLRLAEALGEGVPLYTWAGGSARAQSVDEALDSFASPAAPRGRLIRVRTLAAGASRAEKFLGRAAALVYGGRDAPLGLDESQLPLRVPPLVQRAPAPGSDLVAGPGGVRQVEQVVHGLQLELGPGRPELRIGSTLDALQALGRGGALTEESAASLSDAYSWLRRAEHFIQLVREDAPPVVPDSDTARTALARRMGYREPDAGRALGRFDSDWRAVRDVVEAHVGLLQRAQ